MGRGRVRVDLPLGVNVTSRLAAIVERMDKQKLAAIVADAMKAAWDESAHPRHPAGRSEGGQFAPADGDASDDAPSEASPLKNFTVEEVRIRVLKGRHGADKGRELLREAQVDAGGTDDKGRGQPFTLLKGESRDRGKTWNVYNLVTGERAKLQGGMKEFSELVEGLKHRTYTDDDAYLSRSRE